MQDDDLTQAGNLSSLGPGYPPNPEASQYSADDQSLCIDNSKPGMAARETEALLAHLRLYPVRLFSLVSWGCAATSWTARTLNSHPDILCLDAANTSWSYVTGGDLLDGFSYLRLIAQQGSFYRSAGDVHGISRSWIPQIRTALGDTFRSAVLVREPMARLRSQLAFFAVYEHLRHWDVSYLMPIVESLGLSIPDTDYSTMLFLHGANMLNAIVEEESIGPIYRSEDVTSDPEALMSLVNHLTGSAVEIDDAWVARAVGSGKVNEHTKGEIAALAEWQKSALEKIVQPEAWAIYYRLGYPSAAW